MFNKKAWSKEYYIKNREKILEKEKKWRECNIKQRKEYYRIHLVEIKEQNKKYYKENIQKFKEINEQWRANNPERAKEYHIQWIKNNLDKYKEYQIQYRKNYHNERKEYMIQWRKKNIKKIERAVKLWHDNNIERVRKNVREWYKNRKRTDLKFNLNCKISRAINHSLKGNKNGRHWEILTGYTLNNLIKRLNRTIPEGYCWQDYINGKLHVDHIIPKAVFNYYKVGHTDFKRCWALDNLQLLLAKKNRVKSDFFAL